MFKNLPFFRRQPSVQLESGKVWVSDTARDAGILSALREQTHPARLVILIAHFPVTLRSIENLLQTAGQPYQTFETGPEVAHRLQEKPAAPLIGLARSLLAPLEFPLSNPPLAPVYWIVAEHHPLPQPDDAVVAFARSLQISGRLTFHESLESALLQRYSGGQVASLVRTMNIPEDQPLSTRLLDRTLRAAQEKLAKRVREYNPNTDSAEAWFQQTLGHENTYLP